MNITFNTFKTFITIIIICTLYTSCERSKKDTELFFIQGNVAYKKGNFEEAIKFYSEAIEKTPKFADAYNNRGIVKREMGNIEGAILDFEKAVEIDNKFSMAKYNLAEAYFNTSKLNEANELLTQISNQYRDSSFFYVTLSNVQIQQNKISDASSSLALALKLNPKNDKAFTNLGYIQYTEKKYADAKSNFEKALSINPNQDFALNNLSLIEAQKENFTKSLDIIEKAIVLKKDDIYLNNKAYYLINVGKKEEAKKILDILLEKNVNNAWALRNLGFYLYKNSDYQLAFEALTKADKIDPTVELLNYYLGLTQKSLGNNAKACEYWNVGFKINEAKSIEMLNKFCK